MGPLARYDADVAEGNLKADDEQRSVMRLLDQVGADLAHRKQWKPSSQSIFSRWFTSSSSVVDGVTGLYLWGGVGRGKTHLCDMFFSSLSFDDKTRLHFHRFMQRIHAELGQLDGQDEPLKRIADNWAGKARLLLLDEIHVNDITDAMLLGGLLTALFERGVTLVTTSNIEPDNLYREGLQRARFLPAIAQIKKHTRVVEMGGETDYRLRLMQSEPIYLVSHFANGQADEATQRYIQAHFDRLKSDGARSSYSIMLNDRELPLRGRSGDVVWLDFDTLCNTPRSTLDYIEIASVFQTVLISDIPVLDDKRNDEARRLVNLIDEFYDRQVKLIVTAEAEPDGLYVGTRLAFEFVRAASRLTEMQSSEYLALGHAEPRGSDPRGSDHRK